MPNEPPPHMTTFVRAACSGERRIRERASQSSSSWSSLRDGGGANGFGGSEDLRESEGVSEELERRHLGIFEW